MACLWMREDLNRWAGSSNMQVREWAVDQLIRHYPTQSGDSLVRLLDDKDNWIAQKAARYFSSWPNSRFLIVC